MLYSHLKIWTHEGLNWHSLYRPGTRDMCMSALSDTDLDKTIKWAERQRLTIVDERAS